MKNREWMTREKAIVALVFVAVLLFFGLVRGAEYPAMVTQDFTYYPRDYDEDGDYDETRRCWGVPVIYWSCRTTLTPAEPESQSG